MSSFTFLLICVQAFLVQNVISQCLGPKPYAPAGPALAPGFPYNYGPGMPAAPFGVAPMSVELGGHGAPIELGAYGGAGVGDVAVAGEMPVTGTTLVAGQVPILGAVRFTGDLPASGKVSVSGSCGCGCNRGPY